MSWSAFRDSEQLYISSSRQQHRSDQLSASTNKYKVQRAAQLRLDYRNDRHMRYTAATVEYQLD